ncbi:hypothetical protein HELRODRAFT_166651 [Helobdella robusta]|uniref:B box-type domain-containing protein n=1 Tax=Helobdella robusta TaxID=6412 RepID=T1EYB8_HELRO|nr:hypothetical protein HELRODRAFT_166651 [Helobdella robusta]ESO11635.1 hypothetical protein HELRODRAFT_166651 [Helobdella robusta]
MKLICNPQYEYEIRSLEDMDLNNQYISSDEISLPAMSRTNSQTPSPTFSFDTITSQNVSAYEEKKMMQLQLQQQIQPLLPYPYKCEQSQQQQPQQLPLQPDLWYKSGDQQAHLPQLQKYNYLLEQQPLQTNVTKSVIGQERNTKLSIKPSAKLPKSSANLQQSSANPQGADKSVNYRNDDSDMDAWLTPLCCLCSKSSENMFLLSCVHIYCIDCIALHITSNSTNFLCVRCGHLQNFSLPKGKLARDYTAKNSLQLEKSGIVRRSPEIFENDYTVCRLCKTADQLTAPAIAYCQTCQAGICDVCVSVHRHMGNFRNHSYELNYKVRPSECSLHKIIMIGYCWNCEVAICNTCYITKCFPDQHGVTSMVDKKQLTDIKNKLANHVNAAKNLVPFVTEALRNLHHGKNILMLQDQLINVECLNPLNDQQSLAERKMFNFCNMKQLELKIDELSRDIPIGGRAILYYERLLRLTDDVGLLSAKTFLEEKLKSFIHAGYSVLENEMHQKNIEIPYILPIPEGANFNADEQSNMLLCEMSQNFKGLTVNDGVSNLETVKQEKRNFQIKGRSDLYPTQSSINQDANEAPFNQPKSFKQLTTVNQLFPSKQKILSKPSSQIWKKPEPTSKINDVFSNADQFQIPDEEIPYYAGKKKILVEGDRVYRIKLAFVNSFGSGQNPFNDPCGICSNKSGNILIADSNNHKINIFTAEGKFIGHIGSEGKKGDDRLEYPNRVATCPKTNNIVITERKPSNHIKVFTSDGALVKKFAGPNFIQNARSLCVDGDGNIIVLESKVNRVSIFDKSGEVVNQFSCPQMSFPMSIAVNDQQELFICDNNSHCVMVYTISGEFLRKFGNEVVTQYPVSVKVGQNNEIFVFDNHRNFNATVFDRNGTLLAAYEGRHKHAQVYDVCLNNDGSISFTGKDYMITTYRLPSRHRLYVKKNYEESGASNDMIADSNAAENMPANISNCIIANFNVVVNNISAKYYSDSNSQQQPNRFPLLPTPLSSADFNSNAISKNGTLSNIRNAISNNSNVISNNSDARSNNNVDSERYQSALSDYSLFSTDTGYISARLTPVLFKFI